MELKLCEEHRHLYKDYCPVCENGWPLPKGGWMSPCAICGVITIRYLMELETRCGKHRKLRNQPKVISNQQPKSHSSYPLVMLKIPCANCGKEITKIYRSKYCIDCRDKYSQISYQKRKKSAIIR